MRVAFDTSSMRGRKTGIGTYTESLTSALRELAPARSAGFAPAFEVVELNDGATADQRTDRRILREQFVIPRLAARARAGVLHLTGFAAPWRAPCPVVLTVQDLIGVLFAKDFPPAARFYWSRYLPSTLRFASRLIVLSEHTKHDVIRLAKVSPARIHVIPPGRGQAFRPIEDARTLAEARARLGLPAKFVLFASTLEPRKGIDTLVEAFARTANQIPDDLVIVGKRGWYWQAFFEHVKRAGLEKRVRFLEYVPQQELTLIYNLARVFVFPSRYEGFGLTPLEAMACGTPVICSNAASLPEVVGDAGILVSPDDVEGFARAIARLSGDAQLRAELRGRGLKQVQKFSWAGAARATVEVYRSIQMSQ
jgi:glycosyltransferase involved in cell wall biosynthesis